MRFEGTRVIVTGAARGIGRAIVTAFLGEGAHVYAVDRNAAGLERLESELGSDRLRTGVADLSSVDEAMRVVDDGIRELGGLDVLVNNAGVMPDGAILEVSPETFDAAFSVNARAPFFAMQRAAAHMIEHGGGAFVNVASANAFRVESPEAPYNASKAALVMLTRAFAHELGHLGIRANCIAPGETLTPEEQASASGEDLDRERAYLERVPLRRVGKPQDQANVVLFLASEDAAFVTGETILVDGGELTGDWWDRDDAPPVPDAPL
ncbi:MAG: SDR family NAD(P)-dependent oxidoreductase [Actinomycetota bacterium]